MMDLGHTRDIRAFLRQRVVPSGRSRHGLLIGLNRRDGRCMRLSEANDPESHTEYTHAPFPPVARTGGVQGKLTRSLPCSIETGD